MADDYARHNRQVQAWTEAKRYRRANTAVAAAPELLVINSDPSHFDKKGLFAGNYVSAQCAPDVVAALQALFPDAGISFIKAEPASGGRDVLKIVW